MPRKIRSKAKENAEAYKGYKKEVKKFNYVTRYYIWQHREFWEELLHKLKRPQWLYQHLEAAKKINVNNLKQFCQNVLAEKYRKETIKHVFDFLGPKREILFISTQKYLMNNPTGNDVKPLRKVRDSYVKNVVEPLVKQFEGLVMERVYHDQGGAPIEDKEIAGYLAILMAIHKFDFDTNNSLTSLAFGQFTNELRWCNIQETAIVYMSDSDRTERIKRIRKAKKEQLETDEAVQHDLAVLNTIKSYVRLDLPVAGPTDEGGLRIDFLADRNLTPEEYVLQKEVKYYFIKYLTEEEYEIAKRVFGLDGEEPKTLAEIAEEFGTKDYIISDKFMKIRQKLRVPELRELLHEIIAMRNRDVSYAFV